MINFNYENILKLNEIDIKFDYKEYYNRFLNKLENTVGFRKAIFEDINKYKIEKAEDVVVIGMGGSILGTETVYYALKGYNKLNNAYFLDNTDPEKIVKIINEIKDKEPLIYVVSKSGNTLETIVNYNLIKKEVKGDYIFITNGGKLLEEAKEKGYYIMNIPENVPGRYSIFTAVGLAPLYSLNVNIDRLINGAKYMDKIFLEEDFYKNYPIINAIIHYLYEKRGVDIAVLMSYVESLYHFGEWFKQLLGESLGKEGKGITPLLSIGAKDQHSLLQLYMDGKKDKIITFLTVEKYRDDIEVEYNNKIFKLSEIIKYEQLATEKALTNNKVPNVKITLEEVKEECLGALLYMYMLQIGFMGELYNINAYNQPAVEEEKRICLEMMMK
ncbi:glucose-6-phosphate isomerase [Methanocaldococcus villosus KIN24-T80]|uniref:Glucose-6-phosphate isomerase n=1 Tax=Methanocaldococcus villosus KIN24-T80 TaxID=1069083 RepID=N6V342_9EURY|nr:glucose-6-phosphate isomerase [Methanocaldococcus villosus]ENN96668.1 glucose-6-phosphate isomerase [Methanocaldococcus villosus KIN24-T80]